MNIAECVNVSDTGLIKLKDHPNLCILITRIEKDRNEGRGQKKSEEKREKEEESHFDLQVLSI